MTGAEAENGKMTGTTVGDGNRIVLYNADRHAGAIIMLICLFFHAVLFMAAWKGAKMLYMNYRGVCRQIMEDSRSYYLPDVLSINTGRMAALSAAVLAMAGIFIISCRTIDLHIVIPPEVIPRKLIYVREFASDLKVYCSGLRAAADDMKCFAEISDIGRRMSFARQAALAAGMQAFVSALYIARRKISPENHGSESVIT